MMGLLTVMVGTWLSAKQLLEAQTDDATHITVMMGTWHSAKLNLEVESDETTHSDDGNLARDRGGK